MKIKLTDFSFFTSKHHRSAALAHIFRELSIFWKQFESWCSGPEQFPLRRSQTGFSLTHLETLQLLMRTREAHLMWSLSGAHTDHTHRHTDHTHRDLDSTHQHPLTPRPHPLTVRLHPHIPRLHPLTVRLHPLTSRLHSLTVKLHPHTPRLHPLTVRLHPLTPRLHPLTPRLPPLFRNCSWKHLILCDGAANIVDLFYLDIFFGHINMHREKMSCGSARLGGWCGLTQFTVLMCLSGGFCPLFVWPTSLIWHRGRDPRERKGQTGNGKIKIKGNTVEVTEPIMKRLNVEVRQEIVVSSGDQEPFLTRCKTIKTLSTFKLYLKLIIFTLFIKGCVTLS